MKPATARFVALPARVLHPNHALARGI